MKIAFIGTRGVPNRYGGFEQFVSYIAPMLVDEGHHVVVYNSSNNGYNEPTWKGVEIVTKYDPEKKIGTAGQFIYDLLCILDIRRQKPDIVFQLGYTSSSIWNFLFPKDILLVTNMDGLEWKRSKYKPAVQKFLKYAERLAVKYSDLLIADAIGIQKYLDHKYNRKPVYIPYGSHVFNNPDPKVVIDYGLEPYTYDLVIARPVPENHMEVVLKGYALAATNRKLVIIGMDDSNYAQQLQQQYTHPNIIFRRGEYDMDLLNNLRYHANLYFHGHSVGGTNPSLLEAMSCACVIAAHDNIFNREVLQDSAHFFSNEADVANLLQVNVNTELHTAWRTNNIRRIAEHYNWDNILRLINEQIIQNHGVFGKLGYVV